MVYSHWSNIIPKHFYYLKKNLKPISSHSPCLLPLPPDNHKPTFYLYRFSCSEYFIPIESYSMWFEYRFLRTSMTLGFWSQIILRHGKLSSILGLRLLHASSPTPTAGKQKCLQK